MSAALSLRIWPGWGASSLGDPQPEIFPSWAVRFYLAVSVSSSCEGSRGEGEGVTSKTGQEAIFNRLGHRAGNGPYPHREATLHYVAKAAEIKTHPF